MKMFYENEAAIWEEALPLGNGQIGAMVWSGVFNEKISLNDDTLWSGYPNCTHAPDVTEHFLKAQEMAMSGKYNESQDYIETFLTGPFTQSYLPLGELLLDMKNNDSNMYDYSRFLDLESAIASMSYYQDDTCFTREYFTSAPDKALIIKLSANKTGAISFAARFTCQLCSSINAIGNRLILKGSAPSAVRPSYSMGENPVVYEKDPAKQGMDFVAIADFEVSGGNISIEENKLIVEDADQVTIRFCCRTSYKDAFSSPKLNGTPYLINCKNDLNECLSYDYLTLRERHINDYQKLYKRVEINLGEGDINTSLPKRLESWETSEKDLGLFALLFQFGRYLMISGSRKGTIPLNLQGIWNPYLHPPWSSNYTLNINTEMNYWPAEVTNLSECHEPLFDFIKTLSITGATVAKQYFNAGGFTVNHNSDLWGASNPVGESSKGCACYAFWPLAGGWLSSHVFEHYLYTMDLDFLMETAWPILKSAAQFFLDVLVEDVDGSLIFSPSTSPENHFIYKKVCSVSKTTTMTNGIIREVLTNTIYCCNLLKNTAIDTEIICKKSYDALNKLPHYKIGSKGELLEWSEEYPEAEPWHRHTSHLYPLFPGKEIKANTPLGDACERTLDLRGEEATGWALAWRISLWTRLYKGERAFSCLKKQLRPAKENIGGCYPNLFGAHPPFQIDSNFGATAGIAEMLMQSHWDIVNSHGTIHILPALPRAISNGYIKGLRARGGISVSIYFLSGKLEKVELSLDEHLLAKELTLIYGDTKETVVLNPSEIKVWVCTN